jgi:hypothetical protein
LPQLLGATVAGVKILKNVYWVHESDTIFSNKFVLFYFVGLGHLCTRAEVATSMPTCGVFETETHIHVQKSTRPYLPIPKLCIMEPRASKMRKASSLVTAS